MKRLILICLAVLSLAGCGDKLAKEQDKVNHSTDGGPGSWQCIEHFGDQSRCDG